MGRFNRQTKSNPKDLDEVTATVATSKGSAISNLPLAETDVALDPGEAAALALLVGGCLEGALRSLKKKECRLASTRKKTDSRVA